MSGPNGDWDDTRLDAAYRAHFDSKASSGLIERIVADFDAPPDLSRRWPLSGSLRTALAGLVLVMILASTAAFTGLGPRHRGIAPMTPGATVTTVASGGRPFPASVTVTTSPPGSYRVLSIADASAIRAKVGDSEEIAIGGWYSRVMTRGLCHLTQADGLPGRMANLCVDSAWLVPTWEGAPVGSYPQGPSIRVLSDYSASASNIVRGPGGAAAVVFVGHFDDGASGECPSNAIALCRDSFVVDAIPWILTTTDPGFPTRVAGLDVVTVGTAITVRDGGTAMELAVAGWYEPGQAMFCPFVQAPIARPLEGDCGMDQHWLLGQSESLTHVTRATDSTTISSSGPTGPAFHPVAAWAAIPANEIPAEGDSTPMPVVLIGHFNDRRAAFCQPTGHQACLDRFLVDAVGWANGATQPLPLDVDWRDSAGPHATAGASMFAAIEQAGPGETVIASVVVPGGRLSELEPYFLATDRFLLNQGDIWVVTAIKDAPGGPEDVTYFANELGVIGVWRGSNFTYFANPACAYTTCL